MVEAQSHRTAVQSEDCGALIIYLMSSGNPSNGFAFRQVPKPVEFGKCDKAVLLAPDVAAFPDTSLGAVDHRRTQNQIM